MKKLTLFIFLLIEYAYLETIIPAGSNVSGIWTVENAPYIILGEAIVPENNTLTISPGVIVQFKDVWFHPQSTSFEYATLNVGMLAVFGKLIATGTENDSIIFTRNSNDDPNKWGIIFINSSVDTALNLKYSRIEYSSVVRGVIDTLSFQGAISNYNSKSIIENNTMINSACSGIQCHTSSLHTIKNNYIANCDQIGIYCVNSNPAIANNIISNNLLGILCENNSNPTIRNNTISENYIGIECDHSSPTITNNTITKNSGGIQCDYSSNAQIISNKIFSNTGVNGIYCGYSSNPNVINNLLYDNTCGITCFDNSNPLIVNNTIVDNRSSGIHCIQHSKPKIINTIIWNNHSTFSISSSTPTLSYSLVQENSLPVEVQDSGNNVMNNNPLFVDTTNNEYSLSVSSPCINKGNPDTAGMLLPLTDLAGKARVYKDTIDIGAYEYDGDIGILTDQKSVFKSPNSMYITHTNRGVTFSFVNNDAGNTVIFIYNLTGRLMNQLPVSGGKYSVVWNVCDMYGKKCGRGCYIAKLKNAGETLKKSFIFTQ